MKTSWSPAAEEGVREVAMYILFRFGMQSWLQFEQEVYETEQRLICNPNIGKVDPLFEDCDIVYRSVLINRKSKLVYYVKDDIIFIAGFWDCRRDPVVQAKRVK